METSNPHKLLAGNFDLSFVLLYLFPLLIIALCYNIISQEKENGSLPFILNLPVSFRRIVMIQLLFWFCVVTGLAFLFSLTGYVFSPVEESFSLPVLMQWMGVISMYLLFWVLVAWAVISLQFDSSATALLLVGGWMLWLVIIPAFINNYIAATHKITSRTALIEQFNKQVSRIWDLPDSLTLGAYYQDYPQYARYPIKPLWKATDSFVCKE